MRIFDPAQLAPLGNAESSQETIWNQILCVPCSANKTSPLLHAMNHGPFQREYGSGEYCTTMFCYKMLRMTMKLKARMEGTLQTTG